MGVPTSEVGYTPAMPRREDHEVHKGHVVALGGGLDTTYSHALMFAAVSHNLQRLVSKLSSHLLQYFAKRKMSSLQLQLYHSAIMQFA
jgi:hypothetical protein